MGSIRPFLAPSGALIAIPTYYWPTHFFRSHWSSITTFTFWATTAISMQYHAIPCSTMKYHAIPCNTMQYHAIPCNTMQLPCWFSVNWWFHNYSKLVCCISFFCLFFLGIPSLISRRFKIVKTFFLQINLQKHAFCRKRDRLKTILLFLVKFCCEWRLQCRIKTRIAVTAGQDRMKGNEIKFTYQNPSCEIILCIA